MANDKIIKLIMHQKYIKYQLCEINNQYRLVAVAGTQ
jgi:hypothetical protein